MLYCARFSDMKKSFLILACILFASSGAFAQRGLENLPHYNDRRMHFGFLLGFNFYDFHIQEIENLSTVPGFYSVQSTVNPGYNINIIANLKIARYLDLRFLPGFASSNRVLTFDVLSPTTGERVQVPKEIVSSSIEFPLEFRYRAKRVNNFGMYVVGGIKYNKDLASKEESKDDNVFKIASNDLFYEFGFGLDFYFEYFKFSPQIKASFGYADLLVEDGTFLVEGIHRLESRSILICFTFE